jgi:hypothetical protein
MSYVILDCEQRTPDWDLARLGRLTGSVAAEMLDFTQKGQEGAKRKNLRVRLMLERLTGKKYERVFGGSAVMKQGTETEPEARAAYEAITGDVVTVPGFVQHATLMAGCSLDGAVFAGARIVKIQELKCPLSATHLFYLRTGKVPEDYLAQVRHNVWITGAESADWMSYDPSFASLGLEAKLITLTRDELDIPGYEAMAVAFLETVDRECDDVRRMVA